MGALTIATSLLARLGLVSSVLRIQCVFRKSALVQMLQDAAKRERQISYALRWLLYTGPLPMTHSMEGVEIGRVWEEGRAGFLILRRIETFPNKRCQNNTAVP